jgi:hypothetical protein
MPTSGSNAAAAALTLLFAVSYGWLRAMRFVRSLVERAIQGRY